jgi:hypothetical protein
MPWDGRGKIIHDTTLKKVKFHVIDDISNLFVAEPEIIEYKETQQFEHV